jgi:light-regulated signal transduction histidine kinase (bacteriophytochrome)
MISNYDRVMLIRQDSEQNSQVVAENKVSKATSYLGLHFPEWDIPKPARTIMNHTPFRVISDSYADQIPIISISSAPLDMTHLTCRGVSAVHLTYMQNMNTGASFTINISIDGKLWGFFSLHNRKPKLPNPTLREIARLFRHMFSAKLSELQKRDHLRNSQASHGFLRKVEQAANESPLKSLFSPETLSDLQKVVDAHGVAVCETKQIFLYGDTPDGALLQNEIPKISQYGPIFKSNSKTDSPSNLNDALTNVFPGILSIHISEHFSITFFRKARDKTVAWAGNPEKPLSYTDGKPILNPRNSFEIYKTSVKDTSAPWTENQMEMAREISLILTSAERKDSTNRVKRHQSILINELNHRVRNILSVIRSLSRQSISTAMSLDDYVDIFDKRIEAVAAAHEVGSNNFTSITSLKKILNAETSPYNENCERVIIRGVDASLHRNFAPLFALTIHEMTTNAAKYGALSVPNGTIHISCKVTSRGINLRWKERGGPEITPPKSKGFGSTLIEKSIPYETDGKVKVEYKKEGVEIEITIPDSELGSILSPHDHQVLSPTDRNQAAPIDGTCLVVEDSLIIAMDTTKKLENAGFNIVKIASTNEEAIETISENQINFAILDVNLGNETDSTKIAKVLRMKNIPFVFLTGYDSPPYSAAI